MGNANLQAVRLLPFLGQLASYRVGWLHADVLAGLSVAAVALPTAIAYPAIAGLPAEVGLYAAIVPAVAYAIFGPSRQLMIGPDTGTMIVLASSLLQLGVAAEQRVPAAAALALLTGIFCVIAGLARFGFLASFLSRPVLLGFLTGVSLTLFTGQITRLTGVRIEADGLLRPWLELAGKLDQVHVTTACLGVGLFILLRVVRSLSPRFPGPLLAVIIGSAIALVADLPRQGVTVVGPVSADLPTPGLWWPTGVALNELVLAALGILLVSFGSGIITARSFGAKNHYEVDGNRELIGFGAANIASGLFGAFPVTSSDSRTAVNDAVGGRTQVVSLVSAAALTGVMLFLGEVLAIMPVAALGAVLASAAVDLIDLRALAALWRLSRAEFVLAVGTVFGVVVFGVLQGVILAVAATLAHLLWLATQPRDALLGRIPGRDGLYKLHLHADARPVPGLVLYLVEAGVVFFNADHVKKRMLEIADLCTAPTAWFILDASAISHLDSTAVEALEDVRTELSRRGIAFGIAELHSRPRAMIERSGLVDRIGGRHMIFQSTEDAAAAFEARELRTSAASADRVRPT